MAIKKINYKDKAPIQTKPEIPEENKVNASDLNEIKEVVNNNADEIELRQLKEEGKGLSKNDFTDILKAKLESLNNYSDTEIKKQISETNKKVVENTENDIKQDNEIAILKNNYTNLQEQNTKLKSKIEKCKENMINLELEGQSIHIEDSSDLEGKLEVLGNVEQDVREGYNSLNNSLTSQTVNGLTVIVNKDKSVTIKGKTTANTTIKLDDTKNNNLQAGTYTLKDCQAYIESEENNGWWKATERAVTLTFNNTPTLSNHGFYLYFSSGVTVNRTYYPQLVAGTEEKPYEPYGASPSPEHPSEIRAVGDNINLWDKENMLVELGGYSGSNGNKYDSTIRIRNTKDIELKKDTYTLSAENSKLISVYIVDLKKELSRSEDSVTFTLEKDDTIRFTIENTALLNTKIKLERGNKKTSYSPYGQGSVEIKKQNKNIAPKLKDGKLKKQNTFICNCKKGESFTLSLKGTTTIDGRLFLRTNTEFTEGTDSFIEQEEITLNGTEQKITITSTIDGILYIRTGAGPQIYNFEYLQIEKGKVETEYAEHQEQIKILPIQKPMLEGDYFIKESDGWKEVYEWDCYKFTGDENFEEKGTYNEFNVFAITRNLPFEYKLQEYEKSGICSVFKTGKSISCVSNSTIQEGIQLYYNQSNTLKAFYLSTKEFKTVEELKAKIKEIDFKFYYKKQTPTKLPCTPEQTKVLEELDNFQTYKPVTNITTDSIAKLRLKYIADTKTYVDNKTSNLEQQVNTINQLLSTTKTSSILLDNLQTDIESEVL